MGQIQVASMHALGQISQIAAQHRVPGHVIKHEPGLASLVHLIDNERRVFTTLGITLLFGSSNKLILSKEANACEAAK